MTNNSKIDVHGITDSSVEIKVTQILGKSYDYNELLDQLKTQQKLFVRTPEDEQPERLEISAKINDLENRIKQFKEDVLRLAEQFNRIEINTDRLKRAKEHFDKGEIGESRAVLLCDLEPMTDENDYLIKQRDNFEQDVLPKLKANSEEFLILALSTQSNYDNPNWFEDTCSYFERSINAFAIKSNVFSYAEFFADNLKFNEAKFYYEKYLHDFAGDIMIGEDALILHNLAGIHLEQKKFKEAMSEYRKVLQIFRKLREENPDNDNILQYISATLYGIALVNKDQNNFKEAFSNCKKALRISKKFAKIDSKTYFADDEHQIELAKVSYTLSELLVDNNDCIQALKHIKEASEIYTDLAKKNPSKHSHYVFLMMIRLSKFYQKAIPNRELSIEYATMATVAMFQYFKDAPFTQDYSLQAKAVLNDWGLRDDKIVQMLIDYQNQKT
jgi:tetratricopeptide (TPR) repeat protein